MVYNSILVRPGLVVVEGFILTHHQDLKLGRGRVRDCKVNVMVGCGMQSNTNINMITQQLEFEVVTGCSPDCSSQTSHSRNH